VNLISNAKVEERLANYMCLKKDISTLKYATRQTLALRGKTDHEGNLFQFLIMCIEDVPQL